MNTTLLIIGIVLLIIGLVMLIIGISIHQNNVANRNSQPWYVWFLIIGGIIVAVIGLLVAAFSPRYGRKQENCAVPSVECEALAMQGAHCPQMMKPVPSPPIPVAVTKSEYNQAFLYPTQYPAPVSTGTPVTTVVTPLTTTSSSGIPITGVPGGVPPVYPAPYQPLPINTIAENTV